MSGKVSSFLDLAAVIQPQPKRKNYFFRLKEDRLWHSWYSTSISKILIKDQYIVLAESCNDLFLVQSSVCVKQLAFDLLELLLLSAFPELDYLFKELQEEKHKFGEFKEN
jgi:hypothetical protein